MARIPMTSGFSIIPEGEYIFLIHEVEYDPDFGKMTVHMVTAEGQKLDERFTLKNADDTLNEKALNAFSYFAKTALNNYTVEEIDEQDLVGHYIKAEVIHRTSPSRNDPTKTVTFVNTGSKSVADGFDKAPVPIVQAMIKPTAPTKASPSLDDLLG